MQYSLLDKYRNFAIQHKKIIVSFFCVLILGLFVYLFQVGYAKRMENIPFSEIQELLDELKEKDKDIYNKVEVKKVNKIVKGIDVSSWQGDIDWSKVAKSNIDFVMVRCGYRNLTNDELGIDKRFEYNITEANKYNIPVGVYFYSTAINQKEALEEATFVLNLIKDYEITYPVVYDFELFDEKRTKNVKDVIINDNAVHFLSYIESHGYEVMLYTNLRGIEKHWNLDLFKNYNIWYAQYIDKSSYDGKYTMWQYADNGKIDGVKGRVDLNESYIAYEKIN